MRVDRGKIKLIVEIDRVKEGGLEGLKIYLIAFSLGAR